MENVEGPTDDLRLAWETDEQWALRRKFLRAYWDSMPMDRLICLSNCFVNMEFLGCCYGKELTEEIRELATGLSAVADYRAKRKKIVEITFQRGMEGNVGSYIDTSDGAGRMTEEEEERLQNLQPRMVKTVVIDSSGRRLPVPEEVEDDLDDGMDGLIAVKNKTLTSVKAFVQTADNAGPIEKLNYACYKAKVSWMFKTEAPPKSIALPNEAYIIVDDVLIVRMYFIDASTAKQEICAKAVEIFGRRDNQVFHGDFERAKFAYYSSRDKRNGWRLPDEFLYSVFDEKLKTIRSRLWPSKHSCQTAAHGILDNVCSDVGLPLRFEHERHKRWFQSMCIFLGALLVHECELNQEDSANEARAKEKACVDVISFLTKDYLRVYYDSSAGKLRLVTSEHPITNDALNDIISARASATHSQTTGATSSPQVAVAKPKSTLSVGSGMFTLHQQKLARVRENLTKIPATRTAADRLNIASVRAQVPMNFVFKHNEGKISIFGVFIAKVSGTDAKVVKEAACFKSIRALLNNGVVKEMSSGEPVWIADESMAEDESQEVVTIEDSDQGEEQMETQTSTAPVPMEKQPMRPAVPQSDDVIVCQQQEDEDIEVIPIEPEPQTRRKQPPSSRQAAVTQQKRPKLTPKKAAPSKFVQEEIKLKTFRMQLDALSAVTNVMQRMDQCVGKSKIIYDTIITDLKESGKQNSPGFLCVVKIAGVIVGRGKDSSKKGAKLKSCQDAVNRLLNVYIKVLEGPDGPEAISSNDPMDEAKAHAMLQKLHLGLLSELQAQKQAEQKLLVEQQNKNKKKQPEKSYRFPVVDNCVSEPSSSKDVLKSFVILQQQDATATSFKSVLNSSASFSKYSVHYASEVVESGSKSTIRCRIKINDVGVGEASSDSAAEATELAAKVALEELQEICHTIIRKHKIDPSVAEVPIDRVSKTNVGSNTAIPESNIGNKLLKKLGWTGGGIGKLEQGMTIPITAREVFMRQGLGFEADSGVSRHFKATIATILREYLNSDEDSDLVFSADFSKDQRAHIHNMARKFRLKSVSFDKGEHRQLTVSRQRTAIELVQYILTQGGETPKYKLFAPLSV